jgi:hypothetical protein
MPQRKAAERLRDFQKTDESAREIIKAEGQTRVAKMARLKELRLAGDAKPREGTRESKDLLASRKPRGTKGAEHS